MRKYLVVIFAFCAFLCSAQGKAGADIPWVTYETENMKTDGTVMGPRYVPFQVETGSSGLRCVKLYSPEQYVEFTATVNANSMVVRYSLPDKKEGGGTSATLGIYINGKLVKHLAISSALSRLYGLYPFTNDPRAGKPRNFYDEIRTMGTMIKKGDIIKVQWEKEQKDDAGYCILDLVDLEEAPPPLKQPVNSLSITSQSFSGKSSPGDYTDAFRRCIAMAIKTGKSVWIPQGTFKITGDILLPSNIIIQGAGMWYSTLVGDKALYADVNRRVRLVGNGSHIHLSDFAIMGKLDYRNDSEPNDGIVGSFGTNSTISRIWIEHTKTGMWIENSKHLLVEGCRLRNTIADGINFCVGVAESIIKNCSARGTGDDCFAIWPATFTRQDYQPGKNQIIHCTAQLPFLANGAAIYGGESNKIEYCSFSDISQGSAILISTTFPTEDPDKNIHNNFSGTTVIEDCTIKNCGGFDHTWGWRAAVQICLDKRNISGIEMKNLDIESSLSDGLSVIANDKEGETGMLSSAVLQNIKISTYGIGSKAGHGLWIAKDAHGSLTLLKPKISDIKNDSKNFIIKNKLP